MTVKADRVAKKSSTFRKLPLVLRAATMIGTIVKLVLRDASPIPIAVPNRSAGTSKLSDGQSAVVPAE